jgi:hypothetical protein
MDNNNTGLLDNIIYRANIFHYDIKFLSDVKERNLKLDLGAYNLGKLFNNPLI